MQFSCLEALENVRTRQVVIPIENNIFGEYIIKGQELIAIEKDLKRLEELEKAFNALSKDDEKAKKELSKEIEKNKELNEILEFIKNHIAYTQSLCDRTKTPDNDLICFQIRGLVDKETWLKIYKAIGTPII